MDPKKHPLVTVADLLDALHPADPGMYLLYAYHHELHCCHSNLAPSDAAKIAAIRSNDVNNGLTTVTWNHIDAKIRTLLKEGVIEWQAPKP